MSTLVAVVLWLLLAILVIAMALMVTPWRIRVAFHSTPTPNLQVRARFLGGATPAATLFDGAHPKEIAPPEEAEESETRGPPKKEPAKRADIQRGVRIAKASPRLVAGLLRKFRIERISGDLDVGLKDPADTGALYGLAAPIAYGVGRGVTRDFTIRPCFDGPVLNGDMEARFRVTPAALAPPAIMFAWRVFAPTNGSR